MYVVCRTKNSSKIETIVQPPESTCYIDLFVTLESKTNRRAEQQQQEDPTAREFIKQNFNEDRTKSSVLNRRMVAPYQCALLSDYAIPVFYK